MRLTLSLFALMLSAAPQGHIANGHAPNPCTCPVGLQGPSGPTGPQGVAGQAGVPGATGSTGPVFIPVSFGSFSTWLLCPTAIITADCMVGN